MLVIRKIAPLTVALASLVLTAPVQGQSREGSAPTNAQEGAPIDLTGQWVSVVTEDWRWRMVTPAHGDYASVPLTAEGKATADSWDWAADNAAGLQCRAFGAGGIMRIPGRLRISWDDVNTLRVATDAGEQVRLYHFIAPSPTNVLPKLDDPLEQSAEPTWQGFTRAQWYKQRQSRGLGFGGAMGEGGALRAYTQNVRPGYLRANGVPYSADAKITEQFSLIEHKGERWLVVTTIVDDPINLSQPFVTSTNFRKESGPAGWSPRPCHVEPPRAPPTGDTE